MTREDAADSRVDALVVGSVNRDHVCRVEALPAPGETVLGGEASVGSGGKGGNQAVAACLLGARTALVARVGDDPDGHALTDALAEAGVDTTEVVATEVRTGMAFVFVDAHGENSIVSGLLGREVRGATGARDAVSDLLSRCRSVVVTVGGEGAVVADADGVHVVAAPQVQVVESTGAGDAFTGAMAARLSVGYDLPSAVRVAVRAGAHAVTRPGAQASFPSATALGIAPLGTPQPEG